MATDYRPLVLPVNLQVGNGRAGWPALLPDTSLGWKMESHVLRGNTLEYLLAESSGLLTSSGASDCSNLLSETLTRLYSDPSQVGEGGNQTLENHRFIAQLDRLFDDSPAEQWHGLRQEDKHIRLRRDIRRAPSILIALQDIFTHIAYLNKRARLMRNKRSRVRPSRIASTAKTDEEIAAAGRW